MYVTYSDLIQIGILIVTLVSLVYEISKGKKAATIPVSDGCPHLR